MTNFDGVVLAAGAGTRLRGVMPPFFKPLMTVDGKSLVVSAVAASKDHGARQTFVVVAPDNAAPVVKVLDDAGPLDHYTQYVIQPRPLGPAEAVIRVIDFCASKYVLLLMADNVFSDGDVQRVLAAAKPGGVAVGTTHLKDAEQAARFTRVTSSGFAFEGPIEDPKDVSENGTWTVWLGPVVADRDALGNILMGGTPHIGGEQKLGPLLSKFDTITTVPCNTHDVGDLNGKWSEDPRT